MTSAGGGRAQRVCEVWWARTTDVGPHLDAVLTSADLERRAWLAWPADRDRLTVACALARVVLGRLLGTSPRDVRIDRTCRSCGGAHGKPWLPSTPQVQFSLSHAGDCVAVAVVRGCAVGVDVEEAGRLDTAEVDRLAGLVLAPPERAVLARRPDAEHPSVFSTYWVRKEAVLKATGEGLSAPLDQLVVSPPAARPEVLHWTPAGGRLSLSLHPLNPPSGYVAALAVGTDLPVLVVERDAGRLLRRCGARTGRTGQRSRVTRTSTSSLEPSPPPATTPFTGETSP
jgi:4'-phosphopantetheinyl transferase